MTASQASSSLPDVQSSLETRDIAIHRVGVTSVSYPIEVSSGESIQPTVASFDMFVSLDAASRGTHMSRFMQALRDWKSAFHLRSFEEFAQSLRTRLESDSAEVRVRFPFFVDRSAPVTGETGKVLLEITIEALSGKNGDLKVSVSGPATSLCPCSKKVSDRGAHNQRCELTVSVRLSPQGELSLDELFQIMEQAASTQIFPVLKRSDEKWVTEDAFDHPKFVEDIVRDLARALAEDDRIAWYQCSSENFESIHQHNAYAQIESP